MRTLLPTISTWFAQLPLWQWWNPSQYLAITPGFRWPLQWVFVGFCAAILCLGIFGVIWQIRKRDAIMAPRLRDFALSTLPMLGIFAFLRIQRIPLLGMDAWRGMYEVSILIWLFIILRGAKREYPEKALEERVRAYKAKYLPTKKS